MVWHDDLEEMTEEEKASLYLVPEFLQFIDHSSKILQRALSDNYDYVRDYTTGAESGLFVPTYFYGLWQPYILYLQRWFWRKTSQSSLRFLAWAVV